MTSKTKIPVFQFTMCTSWFSMYPLEKHFVAKSPHELLLTRLISEFSGLTLSILSLFFFEKGAENHPRTRTLHRNRTPKIPGKQGKNAQKNKEILARREKKQGKKKTRKGRTGTQGLRQLHDLQGSTLLLSCPCKVLRPEQPCLGTHTNPVGAKRLQ